MGIESTTGEDGKDKPVIDVGVGQDSTEDKAVQVSRILDTLKVKKVEQTEEEKKSMRQYAEEERRELFGD